MEKKGEITLSRKETYYTHYIVKPKHSSSKRIMAIFFVLLVFVFIFFPIFGLNWRFQIGGVLSTLIDGIGSICLTIGGLLFLWGLVGVFTQSSHWARNVIIGVVLLWIGCWCTGAVLNLFGTIIGDATSSGGSGWH